MKRFRYTIKDLEEFSDEKMVACLIIERQSSTTNVYSPLNKRLERLHSRFSNLSDRNDKVIGLKFVEETVPKSVRLPLVKTQIPSL